MLGWRGGGSWSRGREIALCVIADFRIHEKITRCSGVNRIIYNHTLHVWVLVEVFECFLEIGEIFAFCWAMLVIFHRLNICVFEFVSPLLGEIRKRFYEIFCCKHFSLFGYSVEKKWEKREINKCRILKWAIIVAAVFESGSRIICSGWLWAVWYILMVLLTCFYCFWTSRSDVWIISRFFDL